MMRSTWSGIAAVILLALLSVPAAAADFSVADRAAMKAYVLEAGKIGRYIAGVNALAMAKASNDGIATEYEQMENESGDSLAAYRAKLGRHPNLFAFFRRENLTVDDCILIPFVLLNAGVAVVAPGQMTDRVSPGQIDFMRANGALMERLTAANDALDQSQ